MWDSKSNFFFNEVKKRLKLLEWVWSKAVSQIPIAFLNVFNIFLKNDDTFGRI